MVAGRLREIGGYYYLVLSYRDKNGKRREPSFSTELPVKGNKKKANKLLNELRKNFIIPDNEEELKAIKSNYKVLLMKYPTRHLKALERLQKKSQHQKRRMRRKFIPLQEIKLRICCFVITCYTG